MIDSFSVFWATPPADITATLCWSVIGLMIGSFLNVAIYRIPIMMQRESENYLALENDQPPPHTERYNLITPRSACNSCAHKLSLADNIPLLSFALLKARCRYCKARISWRYPSVELLTAVLSALVIWHLGSGIAGISGLILLWMLIAMSFIDLDTQLLPDELTLGVYFSVAGVLDVFCSDWQGRHRLWRLQAASRAWRLDGLDDATPDCAVVLGGWGDGGIIDDCTQAPSP